MSGKMINERFLKKFHFAWKSIKNLYGNSEINLKILKFSSNSQFPLCMHEIGFLLTEIESSVRDRYLHI